jgi:hypothetical protein
MDALIGYSELKRVLYYVALGALFVIWFSLTAIGYWDSKH